MACNLSYFLAVRALLFCSGVFISLDLNAVPSTWFFSPNGLHLHFHLSKLDSLARYSVGPYDASYTDKIIVPAVIVALFFGFISLFIFQMLRQTR